MHAKHIRPSTFWSAPFRLHFVTTDFTDDTDWLDLIRGISAIRGQNPFQTDDAMLLRGCDLTDEFSWRIIMAQIATRIAERRQSPRRFISIEPPGVMLVNHLTPGGSAIPDAQVLNMSEGGAAIRSPLPITPGERIAFNVGAGNAPVLCQVLACDRHAEGGFHVRCKCILGGFDL